MRNVPVLDDKPMFEWILNPKIIPLPEAKQGVDQTARLKAPQYVFGRGFGRELHPDEDLILDAPAAKAENQANDREGTPLIPLKFRGGMSKRPHDGSYATQVDDPRPAKKKVRIAWADDA
jgi:hypothetical protein